MDSNYLIVRVQDATGRIAYARTSFWSSTGVQTGGTPETTKFVLPTGLAPGNLTLWVVANGISSYPTTLYLPPQTTFTGLLSPGQAIYSQNGQYALIMQTDGNLVDHGSGGNVLWNSGTNGNPGAHGLMQSDGNLVISQYGGPALWTPGEGYADVRGARHLPIFERSPDLDNV